jgi:hypothetical protein
VSSGIDELGPGRHSAVGISVGVEHTPWWSDERMITQKVFVNERNQATILCSRCGKKKVVDAADFQDRNKRLKARCSCGHVFSVSFESRRHYRKPVRLSGDYLKADPPKEMGELVVEDLSRTGLAFTTLFQHSLKSGDIIKINFNLDDVHKSRVSLNVVIKRVKDRMVGAEFCDCHIGKALAFYLLP